MAGFPSSITFKAMDFENISKFTGRRIASSFAAQRWKLDTLHLQRQSFLKAFFNHQQIGLAALVKRVLEPFDLDLFDARRFTRIADIVALAR